MKTREQKEREVQYLSDKLGKAKAVVFADYQQAGTSGSKGMTMKQLSDLRNILSDQNAEFTITKNTLLKVVMDNLSLKNPNLDFDGPIATLFAYDDEVSPIKTLVAAIKNNGIGKVKAGFLGADTLDEARVKQLALLPTKDELKRQTVGVLAAPLQGMVGVLKANLRNLIYTLSEIQKTRGGV